MPKPSLPSKSSKSSKLRLPSLTKNIRSSFHHDLTRWYQEHHRPLPWRQTKDPYAITLSEFMLQQTQVATVIPYYQRWLKKFPNWKSLATATEEQVLKMWEGLGYYSRARNLHRLAQTVLEKYEGQLPSDPATLKSLPGIGPYTSGAIASIAFNSPVAVLDGNVERILTRIFNLNWNISEPPTKKALWQLIEKLLPASDYSNFNQALMELGATVCTPKSPNCLLCPMKKICRVPLPESLPVKKKIKITEETEEIAVILNSSSSSQFLLLSPSSTGRWKGFHRFPHFNTDTMEKIEPIGELRYGITRYRVHCKIWLSSLKKNINKGCWISSDELKKIPLPSPHRKICNMAFNHPSLL